MSDVNDGSGTPPEGSGTTDGAQSDYTKEDFEKLKAKIDLLMDETKSKTSKLKKFEEEKARLEEEKLKEEGNNQKLLELEKEKNLAISKKFKTKVMDGQLEAAALKAGCKNITVFKALAKDYDKDVVFDEEFQADSESLGNYINKLKDDLKDLALFETDIKAPQDGGSGGEPKKEPKTFAQSAAETFTAMSGQ
jgi:hypothetical protein